MRGLLCVAVIAAVAASAVPASAEQMSPSEARRFVVGKLFSYTCFEGTRGSGRIQSDGSVAGYIQVGGNGPSRYVVLPPGTIGVRGGAVCAQVRGMPFQPCFNLQKTSAASFRGSVSGFGFAYCDFNRRAARAAFAGAPMRLNRYQAAAAEPR